MTRTPQSAEGGSVRKTRDAVSARNDTPVHTSSVQGCIATLKEYLEKEWVSPISRGTVQLAWAMASDGEAKFSRDGAYNAQVIARKIDTILSSGTITDKELYNALDTVAIFLRGKAERDSARADTRGATRRIYSREAVLAADLL